MARAVVTGVSGQDARTGPRAVIWGVAAVALVLVVLLGASNCTRQVHPGSVVVSARGGGVDTDQGQVHLTPLRGFRDQIHIRLSCEETRDTLADEGVIIDR